jgi:ATP-dependent Lhr-like helicase
LLNNPNNAFGTEVKMTFNNALKQLHFHPIIANWFTKKYGEPSPPQTQGWPSIATGKHSLILAPTGSGKTLAAFLWSIDRLFRLALESEKEKFETNVFGVHTLYISPLKALNNDIKRNLQEPLNELAQLSSEAGLDLPEIRAEVRTGDTPNNMRRKMLKKPPHILITTPESLYLLLTSEKGRLLFQHLKYAIVDEIHSISSNKRGVHLSLSLERLSKLCKTEPQRIGLSATQKPLERIAAFLGGLKWEGRRRLPRKVEIIDCGQRKEMDLKIIAPVAAFKELEDDTIWPKVYERLYQLITSHKTTLIFANMRAQTERIARFLNDRHKELTQSDEKLTLAHHSSISREMRFEIEEKLKNGQIRSVIATASLEMGIDIGSIDLVVQLEAPKDVSSALQRVGRSGHLLNAVSKGRIITLYPGGLDEAFSISRAMLNGEIEETVIPENTLDVLSQQIVAETAMGQADYDEMYRLVRQSYCYRNLSENLYRACVDLLSGKFSDSPIRYLQPKLNFDRQNNQLIALRGAKQTAVLNGGTIPDSGYFAVRLKGSGINLGEVEEEFVYERRVGETFYLGNSEWRIDEIASDKIVVTPVTAIKPNAPFWKGGMFFGNYETSQKVGEFRTMLQKNMDKGTAKEWLETHFPADENSISAILEYFKRQKKQIPFIATHQKLIAEWTTDFGGEPLFFLHAPLSAGVNGLWAIIVSAALENVYEIQVQYSFDDNGFMLRLSDLKKEPPIADLLKMDLKQAEKLLFNALPDTAAFSIHFRYNAARSLLLPRSKSGKRIPLYIQRLRAADLLQAVKKYSDFPIMLETMRECLYDVFDYKSLKDTLQKLNESQVNIFHYRTPFPSSMTHGIMSKFVAVSMYEYDQSRKVDASENAATKLFDEMIVSNNIPKMISKEIINEAELRWRHLKWEYQARDKESLFRIIEKLAPITDEQIEKRARGAWKNWLDELAKENRIEYFTELKNGWAPKGWETSLDAEQLIIHMMRYRGALTTSEIERALPMQMASISNILANLVKQNIFISGKMVQGSQEIHYTLKENFYELYRKSVARNRKKYQPLSRSEYLRFLFHWHALASAPVERQDFPDIYEGYHFPPLFIERSLLPARGVFTVENFYEQIRSGKIIAVISGERRPLITYIKRGNGAYFFKNEKLSPNTTDEENKVIDFLKQNGASFWEDIKTGNDFNHSELYDILASLIKKGQISSDSYEALLHFVTSKPASVSSPNAFSNAASPKSPYPIRSVYKRPARSEMTVRMNQVNLVSNGRYFLVNAFSVQGKLPSKETLAEYQARLLLKRYGILVKEWYRHEKGFMPWYDIFQALKKMEWRGEIRRGYFVENLSGLQFALPNALEKVPQTSSGNAMLSVIDPALPFGKWTKWDFQNVDDATKISVNRLASNHIIFLNFIPVIYSENDARKLYIVDKIGEDQISEIVKTLKNGLKLAEHIRKNKNISIEKINGENASSHPFGKSLLNFGFEVDKSNIVLWPSAI